MHKNVTDFLNSALRFGEQNAPTILTFFGVLGLAKTAQLSYEAGVKGKDIMERKRKDMRDVHPKDKEAKRAVMKETVKEMAPVLAPPFFMGLVSAGCIIGSNRVSNKRIAAWSAAYSLTETALKDHKRKSEEVLGEAKVQKITEALAKEKVENNPPPLNDTQIIMTGNGDVLCYDSYSGRYFRSNAQKIGSAINKLSHDVQSQNYVSLNEFWDELGLDNLPMGNDFGWNAEDLIRGQLPVHVTAILTPDSQPCLCVDYDLYLRTDYRNLH